MKIAILGFDRQGRSALNYWSSPDNTIAICDKNPDAEVPEGYEHRLGETYLDDLDSFDVLIRTPGLHPDKILAANPGAPNILSKVTTVTNEFLRVCPTKNIIGVTGTKGKGTTSTLIATILQSANKQVHLGGNIGIPPLDLLNGAGRLDASGQSKEVTKTIQPDDWVVLELANYQLIDLAYSPPIAVCLMITPEHLDWHKSLDEYLRAKQQLFVHQTENNIAIYKAGDNRSMQLAKTSLGKHLPYFEHPGAYIENEAVVIDGNPICKVSEVKLPGQHNLENVCAAVTCVWEITRDIAAIRSGLKRTESLPHRLSLIDQIKNVDFYNDSFGTTPETAIAAVRAMTKPTVLILGGSDKKSSYEKLATEVANSNVSSVVVIGKTGSAIREVLKREGYNLIHDGGENMTDIITTAYKLAEPGGAVLLSPACASFDMFKNYEDRGEQFIQAVQSLAQAEQ